MSEYHPPIYQSLPLDNFETPRHVHDANDMQSHKLWEAMFDEDDIFSPPCFDEQIYYDESMPPIYDVFMHNNAFWSNSNAFSLIICKVLISTTQPSPCRRCWGSKCRGL